MVAEKAGVFVRHNSDGRIQGFDLGQQKTVKNWLGLVHEEGKFGPYNETDNLAGINDYSKRNPFKRIANIIEKESEGLFVD